MVEYEEAKPASGGKKMAGDVYERRPGLNARYHARRQRISRVRWWMRSAIAVCDKPASGEGREPNYAEMTPDFASEEPVTC